MSGRTKAHPTDGVELRFRVMASSAALVRKMVAPYVVNNAESVPWRKALEVGAGDVPGLALRGARYREGLTQAQLAQRVGVPQRHISEMENGKRPIGKAMAQRLGLALGINYKVFL